MRRAAVAVIALASASLALAACPGRGGPPARPAPVELEWPDAAAQRLAADAGV